MEFELNKDPVTYETRPIFGYWSRRQALVGGIVILFVVAATTLSWRLGLNPQIVGGICVAVGGFAGVVGLSRQHGLLPEQWMPLMRSEKDAPRERIWQAPIPTFTQPRDEVEPHDEDEVAIETDDLMTKYMHDDVEGIL